MTFGSGRVGVGQRFVRYRYALEEFVRIKLSLGGGSGSLSIRLTRLAFELVLSAQRFDSCSGFPLERFASGPLLLQLNGKGRAPRVRALDVRACRARIAVATRERTVANDFVLEKVLVAARLGGRARSGKRSHTKETSAP